MKTTELIKQAEELLRVHDTAFTNERDEVIIATFCRNHMQEMVDKLKRYEGVLFKISKGYYEGPGVIIGPDPTGKFFSELARKALEEE